MTSSKMTHASHRDPLQLMDRKGVYTCDGCRTDGIGQRYRCDRHNYDLHKECFVSAPKVSFQGQTCHFMEKPLRPEGGRSCDACGITVEGFVYHCPQNGWDFHPLCTKLHAQICIGDVVFRLDKHGPSKCMWCKRKWLKESSRRIPGWSYVSRHNEYNFHVHCVMQMAIRFSTTTTTPTNRHVSISGSDGDSGGWSGVSSSMGVTIESLNKISPAKISKGSNGSVKNKWAHVLQIFLRTIFSILLGDPTTLLANSLAHLATEAFFHLTR